MKLWAGQPHLISSIEQGFLPVLITCGALQSLGLDPAPATRLALQEPQGEPPDYTEVRRGMIGPHAALVLAEAHVQLPMEVVLDAPVAPYCPRELLRREQHTQDVIARLQAAAPLRIGALRDRHPHGAQVPPHTVRVHRLRGGKDGVRPRLLAAMARLHRLMLV